MRESVLPAVLVAALSLVPAVALAQRGVGEVHLHVTDESGANVVASGILESAATQVTRTFVTSSTGDVVLAALPLGRYQVTVTRVGFAAGDVSIDIRSELPVTLTLALRVAAVQATVSVVAPGEETLLEPARTGSLRHIGPGQLQEMSSASPGRSIVDLVNLQPGWLLEANGVLHARGSEYQVQYVVDGMPLRDNRSPAFAQSLGAGEFESITVRTGGYPAEFGGKLGGVIEVNTARDTRTGLHGSGGVQAGSFGTVSGFASAQYGARSMRAGLSGEAMTTDRYLDPPHAQNFTNHGTGGGASARFERAWNSGNRTRAYGYRRTTRFEVPNEALQEHAGQRQERTSAERLGQASHQQVFSPRVLAQIGFMGRVVDATLTSNAQSIPIRASQDRGFTEGYVNGSVTTTSGAHEIKFGGEATAAAVREQFASVITGRRLGTTRVFDEDVPTSFAFDERRDSREQALYAQDLVRVGPATLSAGMRFDRYRFMVHETAVSPRVSGSWLLSRASTVLHASYDRTFEPQPVENLILASSDLVDALGGEGASRGLRPSRGHFVEAGASVLLLGTMRLEGTYFYRGAKDVTDDELLLNTAVSFPIAFSSATVKGFEAALDVPRWRSVSGSVNYSHSHGLGRLPLTGGLFLGDDVNALLTTDEEFALSQDQRHTIRGRVRTDMGPRGWAAALVRYDSGLPVEIEGDADDMLLTSQYGPDVVERVDLGRGRVKPSLSVDVSAGVQLTGTSARGLRLQADLFNALNRLNVINFAGLLSGTAIAPRRSFAVRLQVEF
jgi:hypothetical protein